MSRAQTKNQSQYFHEGLEAGKPKSYKQAAAYLSSQRIRWCFTACTNTEPHISRRSKSSIASV
jgi:hypothetical protein